MEIVVDGQKFKSKRKALDFFKEACWETDGSEQDRMYFAFFAIQDGATNINTYRGTAS